MSRVSHDLVQVIPVAPVLEANTDSDFDGIDDLDEGFSDTDGDRIVDYLDPSGKANQLPASETFSTLLAETGVVLRQG